MDINSIDGSDDRIDSFQYFVKKTKNKLWVEEDNGTSKNGICRHLSYQNMQLLPNDWNTNIFDCFEAPHDLRNYNKRED